MVSGLAARMTERTASFFDGDSTLIRILRHFWYERRLSARILVVWADRVAGRVKGRVKPPGVAVFTFVPSVTNCESDSRFIEIVAPVDDEK